MLSYPFLVSFFQIGESNISLGVSEPRYTLEVNQAHSGSLGKVIEDHGMGGTSHFYLFQPSFSESQTPVCIL